MVSKELNDWLQVVALFGVLGGLIFVGLQLRLDRQVALAEGVQAASAEEKVWAQLMSENAEVWGKGLSGEPLSATEALQFGALATAWELSQYTHWNTANLISEQHPDRFVIDAARELHRHVGLLTWWREFRRRLDNTRERLGSPESAWGTALKEELSRLEREDSAE